MTCRTCDEWGIVIMADFHTAIDQAFTKETYKLVLSKPRNKTIAYRKITINRVEGYYLVEKLTTTQVFHEKHSYDSVREYVLSLLGSEYMRLNSWDGVFEHIVMVSGRDRVTSKKKKADSRSTPEEKQKHNREKNYLLKQGTIIQPLIDMGILTSEGKVINSKYDKFRQINRFLEIIDDGLADFDKEDIKILDLACGKSYTSFILYYYLTEVKKIRCTITGVDLKKDIIDKCNAVSNKYGYTGLSFITGDISSLAEQAKIDGVDMIISLHACDTATDQVLYNAIAWNVPIIFAAPCCQHELNSQIQSDSMRILTRYGLAKERISSLMTDVIRCNLLEYSGYKTQMLEFVDFENSPKNIMIRAVKRKRASKSYAVYLEEVEALRREFNLSPTLYNLIKTSAPNQRALT